MKNQIASALERTVDGFVVLFVGFVVLFVSLLIFGPLVIFAFSVLQQHGVLGLIGILSVPLLCWGVGHMVGEW